ncbi:hypothetical protein [Candidatus Rhabdochlamydia porcellionis]|jgi:hypothetical protein|uniref:Uncharacterized protein n=1 Tax=Candidatus Rhabdochlamydia porcellionis TaxID=225148 RepID=A0ABX8Z3A4_9BACT|nr:hypothetical protein [Candidatus Rhabdochlamydia porcellionis]QZA58567.1 hypothetical protein RHAB15C_0000443 [Candidatus Rhabdochlamydia porcellionis]
MEIDNYIDSLNFSNELANINQMLSSAQSHVTFWGERVVTVVGYEGSTSLDKLLKKVLCSSGQRSYFDDLSTQERIAGIEITNKLKSFYEITDVKISQKNRFTRFSNTVTEFMICSFPCPFHLDALHAVEGYFLGYSKDSFIQEFGEIKTFDRYENSDGSFGSPLRIKACETAIRAKLVG